MPALPSDLRRQLESVIVEARDEAEAAARSALTRRAVDAAEPFPHFTPADKQMRNRLRARGRQAGDARREDKTQSIEQVAQELAYEFWHRMLFARFLAENHLLMHPDGVAVSLEECDELAPAADPPAANGFVLAARYASTMLPQIFPTDDVLLEVEFAPEQRLALEKLLASLPAAVFTADDSLGWVYQFWQSKRKDEVNKKGDKIDARSLSAVTQLFTEHYMVLFLLHNTVGAWHAGKVLAADPSLAATAATEADLRRSVALADAGGYAFEYLRFVRGTDGTDGPWRPAAGTFDGWPKHARDLKTLDPCCGSGHFLVALLELLVRLRMAEEELSVADAVDAVLRDNLHGLELDPRCTQIAAFNVAMAAWKLSGGYRTLPPLNIACTGLGPQGKREDWLRWADAEPPASREPVRWGLGLLHDAFVDAPTLGSLIDPKAAVGRVGAADYETLAPVLARALASTETPDANGGAKADAHAEAVTAQGLLKAAELLAGPDGGYTLVITNVPYLGRGKQGNTLQAWAAEFERDCKADLATFFISRSVRWLSHAGTLAVVSPQNWLFLGSYKKFRERLLRDEQWNVIARLGPGAFETIGGEVVNVALLALTHTEAEDAHAALGIDVATAKSAGAKAALLRGDSGEQFAKLLQLPQAVQRNNPDAIVALESLAGDETVSVHARCAEGLSTGDRDRYVFPFCELAERGRDWELFQGAPLDGRYHTDCASILRWEQGLGSLCTSDGARVQGHAAWGISSVLVGRITTRIAGLCFGYRHDKMAVALVPNESSVLPALWTYCSSPQFDVNLRKLTQRLDAATGTLVKVPFDLAYWTAVAADKYPHGLPEPESDDPTQWLFHGRPEASEWPLQVAVARLVGYRWPAELDESMRLSDRARGLVRRCDELLGLADDDGIVCLPGIRGEPPAAERVLDLLRTAYGGDLPGATVQTLLTAEGMRPGSTLADWLRTSFFEQHCKRFHHRPFVWHIWDGRKDGFSALVNYHKLDHQTLENLTYSYLGDWITAQRTSTATGADGRLGAAEALQAKLKLILAGEPPYDIFVRWKPLRDQPIGWHPDLNDGVRMNIRPFVAADVLRKKPNIKWTKDRGKDPATAPWYKTFGGERINDYHLTLAEKQAARQGPSPT